MVADGFTVHGATYGYTTIDRASHRAITHGVTAYYANLAPSHVAFSSTVAVVPPWSGRRESNAADLEWRDGQQFGGDFVPSRSYREWGFVAVEPTRARVSLKRSGEGWVVQNALGFTAAHLYVDVDGTTFVADNVADGGEGRLSIVKWKSLDAGRADGRFSSNVRHRTVEAPLTHGQFLAQLEGQGFVPSGGISLSMHESEHFVRGEVEP